MHAVYDDLAEQLPARDHVIDVKRIVVSRQPRESLLVISREGVVRQLIPR